MLPDTDWYFYITKIKGDESHINTLQQICEYIKKHTSIMTFAFDKPENHVSMSEFIMFGVSHVRNSLFLSLPADLWPP